MPWEDQGSWDKVHSPTFQDLTVTGDLTVEGSTKTKTDETLQGDTTIGDEGSDLLDINATLNTEFKLGNNQLTNANRFTFNPISDPAHSEGQIWYSSDTQTFSAHIDRSAVTLNIGEENWIRVFNNTGSQINNGDVVYISGFDSNSGHPQAALAKADSFSTSIVAGVATEDISDSGSGIITTSGYVRNVDTSSFSAGETLWLSESTAGGLSTTEPSSPNFSIRVAQVGRSDASSGQLLVSLGERRASLYQQGSVLFADSNGRPIEDNTNFSWDSDTNTLDAANITQNGNDILDTTSTTDNLSEGSSNLYYTDERVDDRVNSFISWDTNLSGSYDDANDILTVSVVDSPSFSGAVSVGGDFTHTGTNLGLYDSTAVNQASAVGKVGNSNLSNTTTDGVFESIGDTSGSDQSAAIERNLSELKSKQDAIIDALGDTSGVGLTQD